VQYIAPALFFSLSPGCFTSIDKRKRKVYTQYILIYHSILMPKTAKMMSVTVPPSVYIRIKREAKKRETSISGLLRTAFEAYVSDDDIAVYSDDYIADLIERDKIPDSLRRSVHKKLHALES
jgi:hypothetical protein